MLTLDPDFGIFILPLE